MLSSSLFHHYPKSPTDEIQIKRLKNLAFEMSPTNWIIIFELSSSFTPSSSGEQGTNVFAPCKKVLSVKT